MKIEIIELETLSGDKTRIYTVVVDDHPLSLYEKFVQNNESKFEREVQNFDDQLKTIGHDTGIKEGFFKTGIGKKHQHICEFKDRPDAKLRLFFIEELANNMIIVGGGGKKPKDKKTIQNVPALDKERIQLMKIEDILRNAEKAGGFTIHNDGSITSTTGFIYYG